MYACPLSAVPPPLSYLPPSTNTIPPDAVQVLAGAAAEVASQGRPARQQLIVVATLVGRVPNLAGLCRTCEVFG